MANGSSNWEGSSESGIGTPRRPIFFTNQSGCGIKAGVQKHLPVMSLIIVCASWAGESPGSWSGDYVPCDRHTELLKRGSMEIGVRFSTSNPDLAAQFARAMNFWASIIEMKWSRVENRDCAIQIVDGHAGLFKASQLARAQFPWTRSFQGWIAFNPKISSKPNELFVTAVHELGHLLGLPHNSNPASVMYFLRMEGPSFVDHTDVNLLAAQHKLRVLTVNAPVALPTRSTD